MSKKEKEVPKSTIKQYGFVIVIKLAAAGLSLLQLRYLYTNSSENNLASYNYIAGILAPIGLGMGLSMATIIQKEYTHYKEKDLGDFWTTMFGLRWMSIVIGFIISIIAINIYASGAVLYGVLTFIITSIIIVDYHFFAIYGVRYKAWLFALTDLIGKLFTVGILLSGYFDGNIATYLVALLLGSSLSALLDYILVGKTIPTGRFKQSIILERLPSIILLTTTSFISGLYMNTQPVILKALGASDNNINTFSKSLSTMMQVVMALSPLNPQLATILVRKTKETKLFPYRIILGVAGLTTLSYVVLLVLSKVIFSIIDPNNLYPGAASLMPILGTFIITNTLASVLTFYTIYFDQEKSNLRAVTIQCILSIGLFGLLIPSYGIYGAALTMAGVSLIDLVALRIPLFIKVWRHNAGNDNHSKVQRAKRNTGAARKPKKS
jgi:O-antigen/teichoic acid export membrane protein